MSEIRLATNNEKRRKWIEDDSNWHHVVVHPFMRTAEATIGFRRIVRIEILRNLTVFYGMRRSQCAGWKVMGYYPMEEDEHFNECLGFQLSEKELIELIKDEQDRMKEMKSKIQ